MRIRFEGETVRTAAATYNMAHVGGHDPKAYLGVDPTAAAVTVTLASVGSRDGTGSGPRTDVLPGQVVIIKDEGGAANSNNITVQGAGGQTLDGASSKTISTAYGVLILLARAGGWVTL